MSKNFDARDFAQQIRQQMHTMGVPVKELPSVEHLLAMLVEKWIDSRAVDTWAIKYALAKPSNNKNCFTLAEVEALHRGGLEPIFYNQPNTICACEGFGFRDSGGICGECSGTGRRTN